MSQDSAADNQGHAAAQQKSSTSSALVKIATAKCRLFRNPDDDAGYAEAEAGGHTEVLPIRSRSFRRRLADQFYRAEGRAPGGQALADALTVIEGRAIFGAEEHAVHVRVAENHGSIFIDLANREWQCVEIDPTGWRVINRPPVHFRRAKAMLPLPTPEQGHVDELRQFVNIEDADWPLVAGWLLAALRPVGPYPALCLFGEQGSAKSTTARLLRSIIDPNAAPIRAEPRDGRDLVIAANNGRVVALDNVSHLPNWLSDALCRLSTGGGFSTRTLYENDEEQIFDAQRPVIVNGIEPVARRSDLLDRSLLIALPVIDDSKRRTERDLFGAFDRARPRIVGGLLSAVSAALANVDAVRLPRLTRMADFAVWATAGEQALGLAPGQFMDAYQRNRSSANDVAMEGHPVGHAVVRLLDEQTHWTGTSSELLADLETVVDERTRRLQAWPKAAHVLGGVLGRLAPNLRAAGFQVEGWRTRRGKR